MSDIADHEFIVNENGELALLLDEIDEAISESPALIVSRDDAVAYLNLGAEESHRIVGINSGVMDQLCQAKKLLVIEMKGEEVHRTYEADVGLLTDEESNGNF